MAIYIYILHIHIYINIHIYIYTLSFSLSLSLSLSPPGPHKTPRRARWALHSQHTPSTTGAHGTADSTASALLFKRLAGLRAEAEHSLPLWPQCCVLSWYGQKRGEHIDTSPRAVKSEFCWVAGGLLRGLCESSAGCWPPKSDRTNFCPAGGLLNSLPPALIC